MLKKGKRKRKGGGENRNGTKYFTKGRERESNRGTMKKKENKRVRERNKRELRKGDG